MDTLENTVKQVVKEMMLNGELFTALDVSNKVKTLLPWAHHRKVRDQVRALFTSDMEPVGWARSPITVTLDDGTSTEALLYHHLSDSWDLDNKYDQQKRTAVSAQATAASNAPSHWGGALPPAIPNGQVATLSSATSAANTIAGLQTTNVAAQTVSPMPTARDLWKQLFATQPSLFPVK